MALFRWARASKPQFAAPVAPDQPLYVLGDVHGRADLLAAMLTRLETDTDGPLICVGDYIDRGPDSATVLRQLHALQQAGGREIICLLGNHDRMLLDFLDDPVTAGPHWTRHGGVQTLASFAVGPSPWFPEPAGAGRDWLALRDALRVAMGPALEAWLRELPLSWQSGNVFVAHAGANPACGLDAQDPHGLLWGGPGFYDQPRQDGIWVAHGHVIVAEAHTTGGRIAVDTGAYATGQLTAARIVPGQVDFLKT